MWGAVTGGTGLAEDNICCENEEQLWSSSVEVPQKTDRGSTLAVCGWRTRDNGLTFRPERFVPGRKKMVFRKGGSGSERGFPGTLSSHPPWTRSPFTAGRQ